jgi:1-phosphofructokinase family hexose kinase
VRKRTLVLALNPSVDAEWRVARARWEEKNTIESERRWAGGKGVNVARWLRHLGGKPELVLPLGGTTGKELAGHLRRERLPVKAIPLREATRVNVIITAADGGQLRFNPPGPKLNGSEWRAILRETRQRLRHASCLVLSGSLPRGVGADAYAELICLARRAGVKTILDCDGEALAAGLAAGPFLVKPNEHELAEWHGGRISSQAGLVRAARAMSGKTKGWVLVSRGRHGALLVNHQLKVELSARFGRVQAVNTVGAGDALVAAVVRQIELGKGPEDWLHWGVAVGTAATQRAAGELAADVLIKRMLKQTTMTLKGRAQRLNMNAAGSLANLLRGANVKR